MLTLTQKEQGLSSSTYKDLGKKRVIFKAGKIFGFRSLGSFFIVKNAVVI
ncbi:hypothetical protein GCM10027341_22080 [Spirosoma knui]